MPRDTSGLKRGGPGRPKGTPNKATAEVRALAGQYGPKALQELARLAIKAESEQARVAACKEILDRWAGKASQPVTGPDGEALSVPNTVTFLIQQLAGADNQT